MIVLAMILLNSRDPKMSKMGNMGSSSKLLIRADNLWGSGSWICVNVNMLSYKYMDPYVKDKMVSQLLIFNMGIPIPGKNGLYIKTGPWKQYCHCRLPWVNTLRPEQNGRYFADNMFKWINLPNSTCILIQISLKFIFAGSIVRELALDQVMAWHLIGHKPSPEQSRLNSVSPYWWVSARKT